MNTMIGIMGGTFDPPHIGHLAMAERVREELSLKEVWFIPTGGISYKDSTKTLPPAVRLAMVALAVEEHPSFRVNAIEAESGEDSYTYRTLERLRQQHPDTEFVFIVGADSLDYMERWREPERIFQNCVVAVVNRSGVSLEQLEQKRKMLTARFEAKIRLVEMPMLHISSTDLRERMQQGKSVRYLVPDKVRAYIKQHGLYQKD